MLDRGAPPLPATIAVNMYLQARLPTALLDVATPLEVTRTDYI